MILGPLALLAAAAAQPGAAAAPPAEFIAGRIRLGSWRAEAVTIVGTQSALPLIEGQRCTVAGRGLHLVLGGSPGRELEIGGAGAPFASRDIVAIELGDRLYEARMLPLSVHRARFSDVDYPPAHADPDAAAPIDDWLAVRLTPAEPWLNVASLIVDLFEVRSIGIHYRAGDRLARARLSVAGLGEAISWCERIFESPRARTLPLR